MRKKLWIIPLTLVLGLVLAAGVGLWWMDTRGLSFSTGQYVLQDNTAIVILNGTAVELSHSSGNQVFSKLADGDTILLLHSGIQEIYPPRTHAHGFWKLKSGSRGDIPGEILTRLESWYASSPSSSDTATPAQSFDPRTAWVNWHEEIEIAQYAENKDADSLPVFRFTSPEDITDFRNTAGQFLSLDAGYDEVGSFEQMIADRDDVFFREYTLLGVYVTSGSGSERFGAKNLVFSGNTLTIQIAQINSPDIGTCDMAGWLITLAVPKNRLENCDSLRAEFI